MNCKKIISTTFIFCAAFFSFAQTTFQKSFGEWADDNCYAVHQSMHGEYFALGRSTSFAFAGTYLVKMDTVGNLLWSKMYRVQISPGGDDVGYQMMDSGDGGFFIFGVTDGGVNTTEEFILFKIDSLGNPLWAKSYGNVNGDANGFAFAGTSDGGFIMTGNAAENTGGLDVYLVRADSVGNFLWSADYHSGPNLSEEGYAVKQTTDGGFIVAGYTEGFGAGYRDVYVLKTDTAGNLLWSKTYGGINDERATSVIEMNNGDYMLGGTTGYGAGGNDMFLMRIDASGNQLWTHTFGGSATSENAKSMEMTDDGGFLLCGSTDLAGNGLSEFLLLKADSSGNFSWAKTFGGPLYEDGSDAIETADKGILIGGSSISFGTTVNGDWNVYVIKADKNGLQNCSETVPVVVQNNVLMIQTSPATLDTFPVWNNESQTVVMNSANTIDSTICYINGIREIANENSIQIFPDPSNGIFQLEINSPGFTKGKIEISGLFGNLIYAGTIQTKISAIDLHEEEPGIYFYHFYNENGEISSGKIMLVR